MRPVLLNEHTNGLEKKLTTKQRLSDWVMKQRMTFCVGDCKVRHGGKKISLSFTYKMTGSELTVIIQKQD